MVVRERLLQFLRGAEVNAAVEITPTTPLIRSGLFDSLALFKLALWVEQEVGSSIDFMNIDFSVAWNTVDDIVAFIEERKGGA
jgi:acyl carrier protein